MTFKNTAMVFAGLAIAVGTLTTKVMESNAATKEKVVVEEVVWYSIVVDSNAPENKEINGSMETIAPNTPECNLLNSGLPCAIQLRFPNDDAPTSVLPNTTVQDLIDDHGAIIVIDSNDEPVYTYKL